MVQLLFKSKNRRRLYWSSSLMTCSRWKPAEGGHGPVYTKNSTQFKQSTSQNFSSVSDLRMCFLGSCMHFWGFSWQGMKSATETEQNPFGKSENRSTSHQLHSIHELNFWKGVGEKRIKRPWMQAYVLVVLDVTMLCKVSFEQSCRARYVDVN